jgi:hypothetical protein
MPSVDDVYNQLLSANTKLDTLHNDLASIAAVLGNGFNQLALLGQYNNDALYHNDQQNDTIICILEHISQNTCALLNQAAIQTALQTEMERDIDGLEGMFAAANPGAALERERLHRLEEKIEKCCPPTAPPPPCTFTKCPAPRPIGPPPQVGVGIQARG